MFFKDIIGQEQIKKHFVASAKNGLVPHAQLFFGGQGTGKLALALAYAQYLNCESPSDDEPCGHCASCVKYEHLVHPDLHFVFPIVKKAAKKKEVCDDYITEWREYLKQHIYVTYTDWMTCLEADNLQGTIYAKESEEIIRKLSLKIYEAKYKVMIIWLPEKMHEVCANKLLKIIEEPYDNTLFLLISDEPDRILPTIQSRCQRIHIPELSETEIAQGLLHEFSLTSDQVSSVAHLAKGSYAKALAIVESDEERKTYFEWFMKLMRVSYARNIKQIKSLSNDLAAIGRESQKIFFQYAQQMLREYFISNFGQNQMVYLAQDEQQFGVKFAPFINEKNICGLMDELALAQRHIEQNVNPKMVFFDLCLKITILIKQ